VTVVTSVITIDIDPTIEIGPITVAWHGLTIVIGILVGGLAAASARSNRSEAQSRSSPPLPPSPVTEQDPLPVGS
jgi:prolipoprotein diacylglyceryltransferase